MPIFLSLPYMSLEPNILSLELLLYTVSKFSFVNTTLAFSLLSAELQPSCSHLEAELSFCYIITVDMNRNIFFSIRLWYPQEQELYQV